MSNIINMNNEKWLINDLKKSQKKDAKQAKRARKQAREKRGLSNQRVLRDQFSPLIEREGGSRGSQLNQFHDLQSELSSKPITLPKISPSRGSNNPNSTIVDTHSGVEDREVYKLSHHRQTSLTNPKRPKPKSKKKQQISLQVNDERLMGMYKVSN